MIERFLRVLHDSLGHYIDSTDTNWELCTYVNTLMEKNARVAHTPSTVLVGHLVDGDVVYRCLTSRKEHGGQDKAT